MVQNKTKKNNKKKPYIPPKNIRGVFAGCGTLLNHPQMAPKVIELTGKTNLRDVTLVYLGTPSYDIPAKCEKQTSWYSENGCTVIPLDVVSKAPPTAYLQECIDKADIILVSGGNTSFAIRRWKRLGLDVMIREACMGPRRVVMAGGSAGAICWFSGGHSDSLDPESFKSAKLSSEKNDIDDEQNGEDEEQNDEPTQEEKDKEDAAEEWEYIRVDGLGFIPGLCCPHHDRVQSNGILRAFDLDEMLLRHPTEVGICIDHFAAFLMNDNGFQVIYPDDDLPGSVMPDGTFSPERLGRPGIWIKEVMEDGKKVSCTLCPSKGRISNLLVIPEDIRQSLTHLEICKQENPDDGPLRLSYPGFISKNYYGGRTVKERLEELSKLYDKVCEDDDEEDEE